MIRTISRLVPIVLLATLVSAQQIQVRMNTRLSSETAKAGTPFEGILMTPVRLGGQDCAKGSPVGGVVTEAKSSGRLSSPGLLQLQPTWLSCHGRRVSVTAEPLVLQGRSHTKNNAVLIGGGAAAGAILGGIMGGGKGAAVGAGVGAGAGTVGAAASGKRPAVIEPEAVVGWNVQQNAPSRDNHSAQASSYRHGDTARKHDDDDHDRDHDRRDDRYRGDDRNNRDDDRQYRDVRFSDHDRVYLSRCLGSNYRLPPGLAKQGKIPPGHAKKMAQAQAIPYECTAELSPIPSGWERVIFDARVILYDATHREIDSFVWQRND
jgi:hypothetical protein